MDRLKRQKQETVNRMTAGGLSRLKRRKVVFVLGPANLAGGWTTDALNTDGAQNATIAR